MVNPATPAVGGFFVFAHAESYESISNTGGTVDFSYGFDYDMRSQLKQAYIDKNSSPYRNGEYDYRKDGNLNYRIINDSRTNFTYAGDLMVEATGAAGFDLDWDDNGNMTTGVSETFTYNWDNKLRSASTLSGNIKYDPSGNRVRKDSVLAGDRRYIVDIVGGLPTTLMEMTDNTILKTYIYANGQVLCQHDGDYSAPRYFYIHDRLGSVRQIMDTVGNVVNYYTYEPFGETIEQTSDGSLATSDGFMFTGQYFDTEIDQYYLRARQYDPHISRFTTRDPVFGKFEEPLTLHRYLYCMNNPTNKIDPSGEFAVTRGITFGVAGGLGGMSVTVQYFYGMGDDMTFFSGYALTVTGGLEPHSNAPPISGSGLTASHAYVAGYSPNAQTPEDLGGLFFEFGASGGAGYYGGGNWSISPSGVTLRSMKFGYGAGLEFHAQTSWTFIFSDLTIGPSMHTRIRSPFEQWLTNRADWFGSL